MNRAEQARLLDDAAALIRLRSANPPGDERPVAEWVAARLDGIASEITVDPLSEGRANVVASFDFGPGPKFLLCTHLDVVPPTSQDQWEPQVREGRLFGRGACDAKGILAAMIAASERLAARRRDLAGRLIVAGVADEESYATGVRALVSKGLDADAAIVGEPTENQAVLASRGALRLAVRFQGRSAHASSPSSGANAIYGAAHFILAIQSLDRELSANAQRGSCAATVVSGGSKLNVIPDSCTVQVDRRLGPTETRSEATHQIEGRLARLAVESPHLSYVVTSAGTSVEPFQIDADGAFARRLLSALEQHAPGPVFVAATDAPHLIAAGIPTAILGPGALDSAHTADESVDVRALVEAIDRYERVVCAFLAA